MKNRKHLERWFEELWTKRNPEIIDEMVAPNCRIFGLPQAMHGPAGFKPFFDLFGRAFATVKIDIDESIEDGDRIAFRCTAHLMGRDGKGHDITGGGMATFENGRFIEAWNQWDFLALLTSMGEVEASKFVDAMTAQIRRA
jgi:hypothetical protein